MEMQRWGNHPACPHCGALNVYQMRDSKTGERQANYRWRCNECKAQFTVRIGTVFEESRIPMRHWCYGFWRAATSKKGVSELEIHRHTGVSYKSALFMLNRIRFAMQDDQQEMLGGDNQPVEIDELFVGGAPRKITNSRKSIKRRKSIVVGIKERGGKVRPKIVADVTGASLKNVIRANVRHSTHEYARGDVHTNSIEGFFGMVRRGLDGIYRSVSHQHLHRYLSEFEFRHNARKLSDGERTVLAIKQANGKRLTYRQAIAV